MVPFPPSEAFYSLPFLPLPFSPALVFDAYIAAKFGPEAL